MSQYASEKAGDNIEFTAVVIGDYEIFLQHNSKSSSDDREFEKYSSMANGHGGTGLTARKFIIRTNANADFVGANGADFTNPVAIIANKAHIEKRNIPRIRLIKVRTSTANQTIKIRWF